MNNKLIKDILKNEIRDITALYEDEKRWAFYYQVQFNELKEKKNWTVCDKETFKHLKVKLNDSFKRCARYKSDRKQIQVYLDTAFKPHVCHCMKNKEV